MSERDNVVSFSERLEALQKRADESKEAKVNNYTPTQDDVHTFLSVLRYFQKRSSSEIAEIELNSDFLSLKITETTADELTNRSMFFDVKERARKVTFDFPWWIFDVDRSELKRDDSGNDAVDLFTGAVLRWLDSIPLSKE